MKISKLLLALSVAGIVLLPRFAGAEDWRLKTGEVYSDVKVSTINLQGVVIVHAKGSCTVPFEALPDALRKQYAAQEERARQVAGTQAEKPIWLDRFETLRPIHNYFEGVVVNQVFGNALLTTAGLVVDINTTYIADGDILASNDFEHPCWFETSEPTTGLQYISCFICKQNGYGLYPSDQIRKWLDVHKYDKCAMPKLSLYHIGFYSYTAINGTVKKVRKYTYSREKALQFAINNPKFIENAAAELLTAEAIKKLSNLSLFPIVRPNPHFYPEHAMRDYSYNLQF